MIYELRAYPLKPGQRTEYVRAAGSVGRLMRGDWFGRLVGSWSTELGPLNRVLHLPLE